LWRFLFGAVALIGGLSTAEPMGPGVSFAESSEDPDQTGNGFAQVGCVWLVLLENLQRPSLTEALGRPAARLSGWAHGIISVNR
jgi:hypothetical protein